MIVYTKLLLIPFFTGILYGSLTADDANRNQKFNLTSVCTTVDQAFERMEFSGEFPDNNRDACRAINKHRISLLIIHVFNSAFPAVGKAT